MISQSDLQKLNRQIRLLKQAAQELDGLGDGFPAVKRNTARILSSIKMIEINVPDILQPAESEESANNLGSNCWTAFRCAGTRGQCC